MNRKRLTKIIIISYFFCIMANLSAEVYRERAVVSYYAGDFNGKKTSNGEYFNMNEMTCASKTLPFDTLLKVTNLSNGLSVQVRVNDRGPFVAGRELDLSKAAAQKLDMIKSGTATVKIEIVKRGPDTKLSQQTAAKAAQIMAQKNNEGGGQPPEGGGQTPKKIDPKTTEQNKNGGGQTPNKTYPTGTFWDFQIGAYSTRENANKVAQKLLKEGFEDVIFQKGNDIFRVVIRAVPAANVRKVEKKLSDLGYSGYIIRERKK